jgi:hypothetical protein
MVEADVTVGSKTLNPISGECFEQKICMLERHRPAIYFTDGPMGKLQTERISYYAQQIS